MTTFRLGSLMMVAFFAASGNALAQTYQIHYRNPWHWGINRAVAAQEWVNAKRAHWQLNLDKRNQRIQQYYVDAKTVMEAKAGLRAARQLDQEALRSFLRAQELHRSEMAELARERRAARRQAQAIRRQTRKEDTAYVLDWENGGVRWPAILSDNVRFAEARKTIDTFFRGKSRYAMELSQQEYRQVVAAAKALDRKLSGIITVISPQSYCDNHRFLKDLMIQAKYFVPSATTQMAAGRVPTGNAMAFRTPGGEAHD